MIGACIGATVGLVLVVVGTVHDTELAVGPVSVATLEITLAVEIGL